MFSLPDRLLPDGLIGDLPLPDLPVDALGFVTVSAIVAASLIITGLHWLARLSQRRRSARLRAQESAAMILFDGDDLVDASPAAQTLLRRYAIDGSDRVTLVKILSQRFPDLPRQLERMSGGGTLRISAANDQGELDIATWDGMLRLTLYEPSSQHAVPYVHPLTLAAIEDELDILRSLGENAPLLIWRQDDTGAVTWANRAYLALAEEIRPDSEAADPCWPLPRLFTDVGLTPPPDDAPTLKRFALDMPGGAPQWFEVTSQRRGGATMHFAIDANGLVEAEHAQRNFVQTLTKTFAHLSIGLAIFDRKRRLVLFNPALLDLTGLPVAFLSSRPQVHSVLDRLRDMNMLPEPKNYTTWRDQVAALEAAAQKGTYCETWNLAGGQTYRVSGRPHPDGAIAFLFEDISHEVSLTRHFRSEIETAQAALDSMDEAVAVFSPAGTLTLSNAAYDQFWGTGGAEALADHTIGDEMQQWQRRCTPTALWAELRSFHGSFGERSPWSATARLDDGRSLLCRFVPLAGGATLVGFRPDAAQVREALALPERPTLVLDPPPKARDAALSATA